MHTSADGLVQRITTDMQIAIKERDRVKVATLRSLLAAFSNAEATPVKHHIQATGEALATTGTGVGSTEVPRKTLSLSDLETIIHDELDEIIQALTQLDPTSPYGQELQEKAAILQSYSETTQR